MKKDAVPSVFHWTREESNQEETKEVILRPSYSVRSCELDSSVVIGKLDKSRLDIEEATDSASEGEGNKVVGRPELVSMRAETSWRDLHGGKKNIDGYCKYIAAVRQIEKSIILKKHTLTEYLQFSSNLRLAVTFIVKL